MRTILLSGILLPVFCCVCACNKPATFRSYNCYCVAAIGEADEEYSFQAENNYQAGQYCNDIEERVNVYNEQFGKEFNCKLK